MNIVNEVILFHLRVVLLVVFLHFWLPFLALPVFCLVEHPVAFLAVLFGVVAAQ